MEQQTPPASGYGKVISMPETQQKTKYQNEKDFHFANIKLLAPNKYTIYFSILIVRMQDQPARSPKEVCRV